VFGGVGLSVIVLLSFLGGGLLFSAPNLFHVLLFALSKSKQKIKAATAAGVDALIC
jgi:hypothetical protein